MAAAAPTTTTTTIILLLLLRLLLVLKVSILRAGSARLRFARVPRVFFCAGSARVVAFKFLTTTTTTTTIKY